MNRTTGKITSQEGGFLNFLRPLMSSRLPLMKGVLTPLAKSVLLRLGLTAGMEATHGAIQKIFWIGDNCTDYLKRKNGRYHEIIKPLKESDLLLKDVNETINKEAKEQKGGHLLILLGTLA